ncbi:MAG: 6-pyruvoyl tetrahydrobiopterin synthase [Gemmatales bacterium]|nr:MAG: 6-pyruvoyl tetrahydrobiopterin synthase [Gemmatales bacterium]
MNETYTIRVTKDHLVFSAGHFISYEGDKCERLHGHNYRTSVEIQGKLDHNYYVFDFITLKQLTKEIVDKLDHRMMLATQNELIDVKEKENSVHVRYRDREWLFPRGDCVLLPIENTTAELLARYIAQQLGEKLSSQYHFQPDVLRIEVEESEGQSATCELRK